MCHNYKDDTHTLSVTPEANELEFTGILAVFIYCKTIICCDGLAGPLCFAYPCPTIATAVIRGLKLVIHER